MISTPQAEHFGLHAWENQLEWFQFSSSLSHVQLFATPWTAACQASLSITNFLSLLKLMSIESVMPSNHLILCCPLLLLTSICSSIRIFSNQSVFCIRWLKYWRFSFSISPSNEYSGLTAAAPDLGRGVYLHSCSSKVHLIRQWK